MWLPLLLLLVLLGFSNIVVIIIITIVITIIIIIIIIIKFIYYYYRFYCYYFHFLQVHFCLHYYYHYFLLLLLFLVVLFLLKLFPTSLCGVLVFDSVSRVLPHLPASSSRLRHFVNKHTSSFTHNFVTHHLTHLLCASETSSRYSPSCPRTLKLAIGLGGELTVGLT